MTDLAHVTEWHSIGTTRRNSLLVGTPELTTSAVRRLMPQLQPVVVWRQPGTVLDLSDTRCRTLILQDAGSLTPSEQSRLRGWLRDQQDDVQVVSTAATALFPLVESGAFDDALYYQLNLLYLRINGAG